MDHFFVTKALLFDRLCCTIKQTIETWLNEDKQCGLVLPGGQTPRPLYDKLVRSNLDWPKIHIALSDERCVAVNNLQSNEYYLRKDLLDKLRCKIQFHSFAESRLSSHQSFDELLNSMTCWTEFKTIAILGMGNDGHIASLFPGCEYSKASLNQFFHQQTTYKQPRLYPPLVLTYAPQEPKQRISASFSTLNSWTRIILLITGEEKKRLYLSCKSAIPNSVAYSLPVAHLLRAKLGSEQNSFELYWAP